MSETSHRAPAGPPQYIAFPDPDEQLRVLLPNGANDLDFANGEARLADDTTVPMTRGLRDFGSEFALSLFAWFDNDCRVAFRNAFTGELSPFYFQDQCVYTKVVDFPFDEMVVRPKGSFSVRMYCIASTLPEIAVNQVPVTTHMIRTVPAVETTDDWATVGGPWHMMNFSQKAFRVRNQPGGNDVDARLQRGVATTAFGWNTEATQDTISPDADHVFDVAKMAHVWRVQAKSSAAGSPGTVDIEAAGVTA